MNGQILFVPADGGEPTDITEGVQALYDHTIGSMDWGSGFLTVEDAVPIAELARTVGFEACEEAERYVQQKMYRRRSEP